MWRRLLLGAGVCVAAAAAALFLVPVELSRATLEHSVAREARSAFAARCEPGGGGGWRCFAYGDSGSGGSDYAVRERGNGCWSASMVGENGDDAPMPPRLDGCVRLRDRARLMERLGLW